MRNEEFRIQNSEYKMKGNGHKKIFTIVVGIVLLCAGRVAAFEWQQPLPGITYTKLRIERSEQDTYLDVFRIDPQRFVIRPLWSASRKTAQQFASENKALIVINANFFDENIQPLGLVQDNGRTLNPFKNISWWSVFCLKDTTPTIVHSSQAKGMSCDVAIQAGPRLVVDGNIPKFNDETSYRTAIGINRAHEVFFVIAHDPISMRELAQILVQPESAGGLECSNALNLDGGTSSQVYASIGNLTVSFGGFVGVPVGLGVFVK